MTWLQKNLDNRRVFINTLINLAEKDDRICLVIPDVGFNYVTEFSDKFPKRFWNIGVTEPSGMAEVAGMALEGMKPYIYSMIPFVTWRVLEMVRNAVSQHGANVKIIGVQGSKGYNFLGFSHNTIFENEDTYHMSPYMECYTPETLDEVERVIMETYEITKPAYIRI